MVDAVVRVWLMEVGEMMHFSDIRRLLVVFYANDGLTVARDPVVLQQAFDSLCSHLDRVSLKTNTTKTEVMVFLPGRIRTCLTDNAYEARMGDLYRKERRRRKVS